MSKLFCHLNRKKNVMIKNIAMQTISAEQGIGIKEELERILDELRSLSPRRCTKVSS
jgi:hypothetical protein